MSPILFQSTAVDPPVAPILFLAAAAKAFAAADPYVAPILFQATAADAHVAPFLFQAAG